MRVHSGAVLLAGLFVTATPLQAQDNPCAAANQIENAESAAPASITAAATITDMEGNVLREGTNGWTCMPGEQPMCLDEQWVAWIEAYVNEVEPNVTGTGFGYMLNCCTSEGESNVDPFATEATEDNEWLTDGGPHIMVVTTGAAALEGLPAHPDSGGPWVMWRDTPYAHIMIPLGD